MQCTATDDCGNKSTCVRKVVVVDKTPPIVVCQPNQTIDQCPGLTPNLFISATDNCGGPFTVVQSPPVNTPLPPGTHPVTVTVCDKYGNCTTCTLTAPGGSGLGPNVYELTFVAGNCLPNAASTLSQWMFRPVGSFALLNAGAAGTPPLAYQWNKGMTTLVNSSTYSGVNTPTLKIGPPLSFAHGGLYRLKVTNDCGSVLSRFCWLVVYTPFPTLSSKIDFSDTFSPLTATLGGNLRYFDAAGGLRGAGLLNGGTASQTEFGYTTDFGIPDINGEPAFVMNFPKTTPTMGYLLEHGAAANGGGTRVNQYTLVMEVLYSDASSGKRRALFQTQAANTDDADIFLNEVDGLGVDGEFDGLVPPNTWTRIAVVVDLTAGIPTLTKYIDGLLVAAQPLSEGLDGRWSLNPSSDAPLREIHKQNHAAAATPATDGRGVCVYHATFGLVAYDFDGRELWRQPMPGLLVRNGSGTSPAIHPHRESPLGFRRPVKPPARDVSRNTTGSSAPRRERPSRRSGQGSDSRCFYRLRAPAVIPDDHEPQIETNHACDRPAPTPGLLCE